MIEFLPAFLLVVPLLAAVLVSILPSRRRRVAAGASAFFLLLFSLFLSFLPLTFTGAGIEWALWGQSWLLTEGVWVILRFLYAGATLLFLMAALWPVPPAVPFVAAGLATLSPLAVVLILPFPLGAPALLLAAIPLVIMVQPSRSAESGRAALHYLIFATLPIPFLLLAGWMLGSEQLAFLNVAWRLVLLGLVLLLAGFPFFLWVRPLAAEAPPLLLPFLFGLVHLVFLVFAFQLLQTNLLLESDDQFYRLLRWSGVGTAVAGSILAWKPQKRAQLVGAFLLLDLGNTIVALSLGSDGVRPALLLVASRFVSLLLVLTGDALLQHASREENELQILSTFSEAPGATALLLYGLLSLLGLPLTPGFSGRWAVLSLVAVRSLWPALLLLLALVGAAVALFTHLYAFFGSPSPDQLVPAANSLPQRVFPFLLLTGAWALALYPYPFLSFADYLARLLMS